MKKILIVSLLSVLAVFSLALNVQAASVSFNPRVVKVKVAPGDMATATSAVQGHSIRPYTLNLMVGSRMVNGNIPPGWIRSANLTLSSRTGGSSSSPLHLQVTVPSDAVPGFYSGMTIPVNMRSSEKFTSSGLVVAIEVTGVQSKCPAPPVFSDFAITPENIWAPADREIAIGLSGKLTVADGCRVTVGYSLETNNGTIQGPVVLNRDGSFTKNILAVFSRSGKDKEGKIYNGKLFAIDEEGQSADLNITISVLHDRRKK